MGENLGDTKLQNAYTQAWRPFFNVCGSSSTVYGAGYSSQLGVAGTVTGEDFLSVQWQNGSDYTTAGDQTRAFTVMYRHYF